MNKNELIEAMAAKTGSTKADASRALAALTEIINGYDVHPQLTLHSSFPHNTLLIFKGH